MERKIKVLIVDDSAVSREIISMGISTDPAIKVISKAIDPFDARDKIIQFRPDVVICDVNMPKMSGIEFIKRLLPQYPLPVIIISSANSLVFDAMNAGAVGFIVKPNNSSVRNIERFINDLIDKVKEASIAKIPPVGKTFSKISSTKEFNSTSCKIVAIGASTGGTDAIHTIIRSLPASMPGIVIVQHIPPVFSKMFADRLNDSTEFEVKEAQSGDFITPGKILLAPGDHRMKVKKLEDRFIVQCYKGEKVNGHCPSVDILFESIAQTVGRNAIGVILTGMGYDGAKGLLAMKRKGAKTIGQDEKTSVVYGMPKIAYNIGAVDKQASLNDIPNFICSMIE